MVRALWTAASGMIAQRTNVDNIANNLANVNTTGYKSSTAEFKSLLYQTIQTHIFCTPARRSAPESDGLRHPHCIPPIRLFCALHLPLSAAGAVLPRHIP